jgi:hypothetical protein
MSSNRKMEGDLGGYQPNLKSLAEIKTVGQRFFLLEWLRWWQTIDAFNSIFKSLYIW